MSKKLFLRSLVLLLYEEKTMSMLVYFLFHFLVS